MIRFGATVAMLGLTALYVMLHPPANLALGQAVLASCPVQLGSWNGADLSFEDAVVEELKADDLLIRRYVRGDDLAWLCLVYHQNRRYGAHDPRICYESQGYLLGPQTRVTVDDGTQAGLDANRFVAQRGKNRRVVYYWWTTRGLTTADASRFRGRLAMTGALENRSWGAFVRVEALMRGEEQDGDRIASEFAAEVARALPGVFASAEAPAGAR